MLSEPKKPIYGAQVFIHSEEELKEMKALKKEQKKAARVAHKHGGSYGHTVC